MKTKSNMMLPFVLAIAINLFNIGCAKQTPSMNDTTLHVTAKSYLALGDSYTIGEAVPESERFPVQTSSILQQQHLPLQPVDIIAVTGWTTANLANAIAAKHIDKTYDVVSLLIGVNDQYQHLDTAGYALRFTHLLEKSIQLAGNKPTHVFVLSIPDYGVTPFGGGKETISKEIEVFNAINKKITLAHAGVVYIDITPSTKMAATDASLTAEDGLHPSGKLYRIWAEKLAAEMLKVLK